MKAWLTMLAVETAFVTLLGALFWRGRNVRVGLATGLGLAAIAVLIGLCADILASAS